MRDQSLDSSEPSDCGVVVSDKNGESKGHERFPFRGASHIWLNQTTTKAPVDVVAVIELDIHLLYHVLLTVFRDGGRIPYVIPYVWLPLSFLVN